MTAGGDPRPVDVGLGIYLEAGGGVRRGGPGDPSGGAPGGPGDVRRAGLSDGSPDLPPDGAPLVVFLHGSAASGAVWKPVVRELADRRPDVEWLLVDLPGHGRSRRLTDYSPDAYADAVGGAVGAFLDGRPGPRPPVHLVGHSLGGMVALAVADGTRGIRAASALVIAMKVSWTEDELARRVAAATRPVRVLPDAESARELFRRISGMGAAAPGAGFTEDELAGGVSRTEDGYRLAADPRITAAPPATAAELAGLAERARRAGCPIGCACGDRDPGVRPGDLAEVLAVQATVLPDAGHNVHVERPGPVADLVTRALRPPPPAPADRP